jgi:hypothetical protein
MTDVKRPNYFTSQFLVAQDLNDEQAYHLGFRQRHLRTMHAAGIAEGLDVTLVGGTQVQVGAGSAIDREGHEIVLVNARTYTLVSGGVGDDVYLTVSYHEDLDPADEYTQTGLGQFTRVTERPVLQDTLVVPPADGSVIVLARIRLNGRGVIESNASIDTGVRAFATTIIARGAVGERELAEPAVTLNKLAAEVQPFAIQGADAIKVDTDSVARRIAIGETHAARADNPHATSAAQIDTRGGVNRIAAQINGGAGVIARPRIESAVVTGVVTFEQVPVFNSEIFSDVIDPGVGPGPLDLSFAIDDVPAVGSTTAADQGFGRDTILRSETDEATGRFRIFATRGSGSAPGQVKVRWFATRATPGPNATVDINVTLSPSSVTLHATTPQVFTATVNSADVAVGWSLAEPNAGTLSNVGPTSVTYTPPAASGTYHVVATSHLDPTKTGSAEVKLDLEVVDSPPPAPDSA